MPFQRGCSSAPRRAAVSAQRHSAPGAPRCAFATTLRSRRNPGRRTARVAAPTRARLQSVARHLAAPSGAGWTRAGRFAQGTDGGAALADIASDVGFADQAHMSRVLRQLTGLTPPLRPRRPVADGRSICRATGARCTSDALSRAESGRHRRIDACRIRTRPQVPDSRRLGSPCTCFIVPRATSCSRDQESGSRCGTHRAPCAKACSWLRSPSWGDPSASRACSASDRRCAS